VSYYKLGDVFKWFIARVVDINDEEMLGRVKIRVIHEQTGELGKNKKSYGILDEDLLWAYPISAIQSSSLNHKKIVELEEYQVPDWIDAVGLSPTGIAVGTYCFGFYMDGQESNVPVIFGTYHKMSRFPEPPTDESTGKMLQIDVGSDGDEFLNDVASNARGTNTLPKEEIEGDAELIKEPKSAYAAKYPYNLTYTSKGGNAIEIDDTPTSERIHAYHPSGSYIEIGNVGDAKGRRVDKITDNNWTITMKDNHLLVKGNGIVEIDIDSTVFVGNSSSVVIVNNSDVAIGNNSNVEIGSNSTVTVGENSTVMIKGNSSVNVDGTTSVHSVGAMSITSDASIAMDAPTINVTGSTINIGDAGGSITSNGIELHTHVHDGSPTAGSGPKSDTGAPK